MNNFKKEVIMSKSNFIPDNEIANPILVRANKVGTIILGWNPKTAANWRSEKKGPPYYQDDRGSIYYKVDELLEFFTRHQVETQGCSPLTSNLEI